MTRPVFLAEDLSCVPSSLAVGEHATLGGSEGRHAASVRRIGAGEWVDVVDGRGLRLICEVAGADKSSLSLVVREIVQEDAPLPEIILVQALAKGGRDEAAVEICTEIGIDRVIPWASQRAIVQWKGPKAEKGRAKWEGVARAAAKQSRRAYVPVVDAVADSRELASWVDGSLPARVALIVGPEGGIGPEETAQLVDAGARTVGLGANVLRSSTAGAVALTLIRAAAGAY